MLNIAICDDDILMTERIEMMVQKISKQNFVDTDIEVFWDGGKPGRRCERRE